MVKVAKKLSRPVHEAALLAVLAGEVAEFVSDDGPQRFFVTRHHQRNADGQDVLDPAKEPESWPLKGRRIHVET